MRSLSRRHKVFHDFPCWPLTTSSVGATRILHAVAQTEGRVGAACAPHRPYARGAINEEAAI